MVALQAGATVEPRHWETAARLNLARLTEGDFSNQALQRISDRMDPAMLAVARRYDLSLTRGPSFRWRGAQAADEPPAMGVQALSAAEAMLFNASVPVSSLPMGQAAPFVLPAGGANAAYASECLTAAIYYEANSESDAGQAAVAQVVLNRLRHPIFPKSVCGVVFQGSKRLTGCQFTFTCDGSLARIPDPVGWARAQKAAQRALNGYVEKSVGNATHYHTVWVVPYWMPTLVKLNQIGAHIFYRWDGGAGLSRAFNGAYAASEGSEWAAANPQTLRVEIAMVETAPVATMAQTAMMLNTETIAVAAPQAETALEAAVPTSALVLMEAKPAQSSAMFAPKSAPRLAMPSNW